MSFFTYIFELWTTMSLSAYLVGFLCTMLFYYYQADETPFKNPESIIISTFFGVWWYVVLIVVILERIYRLGNYLILQISKCIASWRANHKPE